MRSWRQEIRPRPAYPSFGGWPCGRERAHSGPSGRCCENGGVFHSLVNAISGSAWSYAIIFGVAALDGFFPLVPSETTVIAAGVIAASGDLRIELILPAAAAGAVCGDNVSFWVGRLLG